LKGKSFMGEEEGLIISTRWTAIWDKAKQPGVRNGKQIGRASVKKKGLNVPVEKGRGCPAFFKRAAAPALLFSFFALYPHARHSLVRRDIGDGSKIDRRVPKRRRIKD